MSYVFRRLAWLVPLLFGISSLSFLLARVAGDPTTRYVQRVQQIPQPGPEQIGRARRELGLDRPLLVQYGEWVSGAVRGQLGISYTTLQPVSVEFAHRLPRTLRLVVPGFVLALLLGIPLGIISVGRGPVGDILMRLICLSGASIPTFWLAVLLIDLFAVRLRLVPIVAAQGDASLVLPVLTLALPMAGWIARFTRSAMLDVVGADYVRTGTVKGVRHSLIMERHVLPNALLPLLTVLGATAAYLLSGAAIVETIFAWPGLGALAIDATRESDYPVIQAFMLYTGTLFVLINLAVDMAYTVADPRVRLQAP